MKKMKRLPAGLGIMGVKGELGIVGVAGGLGSWTWHGDWGLWTCEGDWGSWAWPGDWGLLVWEGDCGSWTWQRDWGSWAWEGDWGSWTWKRDWDRRRVRGAASGAQGRGSTSHTALKWDELYNNDFSLSSPTVFDEDSGPAAYALTCSSPDELFSTPFP